MLKGVWIRSHGGLLANGARAESFGRLRRFSVRRRKLKKNGPKPGYILNEELSWKTALTIAKAMKPTNVNTLRSTALAITRVKTES